MGKFSRPHAVFREVMANLGSSATAPGHIDLVQLLAFGQSRLGGGDLDHEDAVDE